MESERQSKFRRGFVSFCFVVVTVIMVVGALMILDSSYPLEDSSGSTFFRNSASSNIVGAILLVTAIIMIFSIVILCVISAEKDNYVTRIIRTRFTSPENESDCIRISPKDRQSFDEV